jgi:hemerythrin
MAFKWDEKYATGVPEVDEQHRKLFGMLDDLERRLTRSEPPNRMADLLEKFKKYTVDHFAWEEVCMDRTGCSTACVNKMAHQRFLRMLNRALADHTTNPDSREVFVALHQEGETWLKEHICAIDVKLRNHVVLGKPA